MRGDGSLFRRGKVYWCKFYRDGKPFTMSLETTVKEIAKNRMRDEVAKARSPRWLDPKQRSITVGELITDLLHWYCNVADLQDKATRVEAQWENHLKQDFEHVRAESFGTAIQRAYRARRLKEGAAPATINLELQNVRRAFKLAYEAEPPKVLRVPKFEMPAVDNARKVFMDTATMDKLRIAAGKLGLWQRAAVEIAFTYGWRRGELLRLRVKDINLTDRLIRLETTKNGDAREVPIMADNLYVLLQALVTNRKPDEKLLPTSAMGLWYMWNDICKAAGVEPGKKNGFVMHDARRSSARNKSAAGVSNHVIMQMQGWTTDTMFRRYAIVDQNDMRQALAMEAKQKELNAEANAKFDQIVAQMEGRMN